MPAELTLEIEVDEAGALQVVDSVAYVNSNQGFQFHNEKGEAAPDPIDDAKLEERFVDALIEDGVISEAVVRTW